MQNLLRSQFLHNPADVGLHCHAPTLARTRSGDLLAVWYAYPEQESRGGVIAMARMRAGSGQWGKGQPAIGPFEYSSGNPVIFEEPGAERLGLLFVLLKGSYWNDAQLVGAWSDDGGLTWTHPTALWPGLGMMIRHPPLVVGNGVLLLPAYDERRQRSVLLSCVPPYEQWSEAYAFENLEVIQPVLVQEEGKSVSIFFRPTQEPFVIWRSRSGDGGRTWAEPIRTSLPNPLSGISAFYHDGRLAVVTNHTPNHQRFPLSIAMSSNGGASWSRPWHFDSVGLEVSYPSFLCDGRGIVHGLYTFNRRMIKYVSFELKACLEEQGG